MDRRRPAKPATWFRWAVAIGILQDFAVGLPGMFAPNAVLQVVAEPVATPVWPAFAAQLLVLLGLFYIPAVLDPVRYKIVAILAVLARVAGFFFFVILWRGAAPAWLGYMDLTFAIVQGILLWLTLREPQVALGLPEADVAA